MPVHFQLEDTVRHQRPFLRIALGPDKAQFRPFIIIGPDLFENLVFVIDNDAVGRVDDVFGGTVVLFQLEQLEVGVIFFEVEDILDAGAAESIDALGIVAHYADILVVGGQPLDDQVLAVIGVLVFIHKDILEFPLVFDHHLRELLQQDVHVDEQVVEVHGVRFLQPFRIGKVDLAKVRSPGRLVGLA